MPVFSFFNPLQEKMQPDPIPGDEIHFLPIDPHLNIAQSIYLSGFIPPQALCNGIGTCGRCRARFLSAAPAFLDKEERFLSREELDLGWRLACLHKADHGTMVEVPSFISSPYGNSNHPPTHAAAHLNSPTPCFYLGIDMGTTNLCWALGNQEGQIIHAGRQINPQIGAGSDCIARLAVAMNDTGRTRLYDLSLKAMQSIARTGASLGKIAYGAFAGNTVMTALCFNKPICGLLKPPYTLSYSGGCEEQLNQLPPLWVAPQFSAFIGGDIASGLSFIGNQQKKIDYPFLLADLGTNGEFLLGLNEKEFLGTSVALGPALEGTGLTFGTDARKGSITHFFLSPQGLQTIFFAAEHPEHTVGEKIPGISGTGYLSLIHCLLQTKALSSTGQFTFTQTPWPKKFIKPYVQKCSCPVCQKRTLPAPPLIPLIGLPHQYYLLATDIEEVLKVKAAFSLGFSALLKEAGLKSHQVKKIYLAGSLGEHINPHILENLGFIPRGSATRLTVLGNSSVKGACLLAASPKARTALLKQKAFVSSLNLAEQANFLLEFTRHMQFSWIS